MKKPDLIKTTISCYLFIVPAAVFFIVFIAYPVFFIIYGSFFNWSSLANMKFIGIGNYIDLFKDRVFFTAARNALYWILITVFIQMVLGFSLAYIIEEKLFCNKPFFRTLFFIPVVTSVVAIAIVFKNMFSPYQGLITNALYKLGFKGPFNWLGDYRSAVFAVIGVNIWEWTGWSMLLYVAGLSQISTDIREAVEIDGVSEIKKIFAIYVPLLSSVHKTLIMLGIIGSLQTFALVYTMTGGGPNSASEMPGTYIFKAGFRMQKMGYASAVSVVVLLTALLLTIRQVVSFGSGNVKNKGSAV